MTTKNKRKARILALQALYACDLRSGEDTQTIFETIKDAASVSDKMAAYARMLVEKVQINLQDLDALIQKFAENWVVSRMATIDRNILRLAVTELQYCPELSHKIILDEAVELAKIYGAEESGKFINGVLDSLYQNEFKQ